MPLDQAYIDVALQLAEHSGDVLRSAFRTPVKSEAKADDSPVTAADREVERMMRALIRERFPRDGILGEEEGSSNASADYVWVLDPIDGTKAFMAGIPTFTTLIALLYKNVPVLGVVHQPITKETWLGITGEPTTLNGQPVSTRPCASLEQAMLSTTSPYLFSDDEKPAFERVRAASRYTVYGGDAYAYCMVASGQIDVVIEAGLKPYDWCALMPIIKGAGGTISGWQGEEPEATAPSSRILAAGSRAVHAETLGLLS